MLEQQPEDVVNAALWELEAAIAPALPDDALIQSHLAEPHVLSITARWAADTGRHNEIVNTAVLRFPADTLRAYMVLHHPKRAAAAEQLRAWFAKAVREMQTALVVDVGADLHCMVPSEFFVPQPCDM